MGINFSDNNAAFEQLSAHVGHEITCCPNSGHGVDLACETCGEILFYAGKPGIDACARCGSPLYAEDGHCYDETCPFSDCQQGDPRGWIGHPDPPKE